MSWQKLQNDQGNEALYDQLFKSILTLKSIEECYVFFDDLCTVK